MSDPHDEEDFLQPPDTPSDSSLVSAYVFPEDEDKQRRDGVFEKLHCEALEVTEKLLCELKTLKAQVRDEIDQERSRLRREKANWERLSERYKHALISNDQRNPDKVIKLNIGGRIFMIAKAHLVRRGEDGEEDSFFSGLFSGRWDVKLEEDGCLFIDRCPIVFDYIMAYLRGEGDLAVNLLSQAELSMLQKEADYYQLRGLIRLTSTKLLRFQVVSSSNQVMLSGGATIARRIQSPSIINSSIVTSPSEAANEAGMVLGPSFDIPSQRYPSPEFYEHSIRFVSGTNIDVGVIILATNDVACSTSPQSQQKSNISSSSLSYFRRFFIPTFSKVSVRVHRDHSVSFAVDDKPNGAAYYGLAMNIGAHGARVAVVLNSKNDCVEIVD